DRLAGDEFHLAGGALAGFRLVDVLDPPSGAFEQQQRRRFGEADQLGAVGARGALRAGACQDDGKDRRGEDRDGPDGERQPRRGGAGRGGGWGGGGAWTGAAAGSSSRPTSGSAPIAWRSSRSSASRRPPPSGSAATSALSISRAFIPDPPSRVPRSAGAACAAP